ncbi:MAG: hypothetical protein NT093_04145 [Candidatus Moranbacteria bacterium]|nr:hypothetical protein [Candidatus Moranbacteria bacterium]
MQEYTIENEKYEVFTSFKGKFSPKISISKPGIISFSSGMNNRYDLKRFKAVEVLISEDRKKIAFKFSEEEKDGMVSLRGRDTGGRFISAKSFIAKYALEGYYGKGFVPDKITHPEQGELFLIRLDQAKDAEKKSE